MYQRTLGHSGIQVSALGLGCWAIGGPFNFDGRPAGWSQVNDAESLRAIECALDLGVTFFDTANVYGCGHSEEVLGKALSSRRDQVVIATKFGNTWASGTRDAYSADPMTPAELRRQLEDSLRRLNTDYLDLYQFHQWGYPADQAAPLVETLEALVAEGKIRGYGWSTDLLESARAFANGPHCIAVQQQLNVFEGNPSGDTDGILALCEARNLASINRAPLAMGILTGKFQPTTTFSSDDVRSRVEWFGGFQDGKPNPEWLRKIEAVREVLTSGGRTLTQGALAWIWGRSEKTIPIPGFKTVQ
ncbi:MAG: aldo/keto reductase, partial [Chloroflexi bacterium]|nr:aldo/keto reductase [Chloroflexota bacterium]